MVASVSMPWAMTPFSPAFSAASSTVWIGLKSPDAPAYFISCSRVTGGSVRASNSSPTSQAGAIRVSPVTRPAPF